MVEKDTITLELAKMATVKSVDESHTAIVFETMKGRTGAVLESRTLSNLVAAVIQEAVKATSKSPPKAAAKETLSVLPVPISFLSYGRGRSPSEAILMLEVGNLRFQFAVELSLLMSVLRRIDAESEGAP